MKRRVAILIALVACFAAGFFLDEPFEAASRTARADREASPVWIPPGPTAVEPTVETEIFHHPADAAAPPRTGPDVIVVSDDGDPVVGLPVHWHQAERLPDDTGAHVHQPVCRVPSLPPRHVVKTDAAGVAASPELVPGRWWVRTARAGEAAWTSFEFGAAAAVRGMRYDKPLRIELAPYRELEVEVVTLEGQPLHGAVVAAMDPIAPTESFGISDYASHRDRLLHGLTDAAGRVGWWIRARGHDALAGADTLRLGVPRLGRQPFVRDVTFLAPRLRLRLTVDHLVSTFVRPVRADGTAVRGTIRVAWGPHREEERIITEIEPIQDEVWLRDEFARRLSGWVTELPEGGRMLALFPPGANVPYEAGRGTDGRAPWREDRQGILAAPRTFGESRDLVAAPIRPLVLCRLQYPDGESPDLEVYRSVALPVEKDAAGKEDLRLRFCSVASGKDVLTFQVPEGRPGRAGIYWQAWRDETSPVLAEISWPALAAGTERLIEPIVVPRPVPLATVRLTDTAGEKLAGLAVVVRRAQSGTDAADDRDDGVLARGITDAEGLARLVGPPREDVRHRLVAELVEVPSCGYAATPVPVLKGEVTRLRAWVATGGLRVPLDVPDDLSPHLRVACTGRDLPWGFPHPARTFLRRDLEPGPHVFRLFIDGHVVYEREDIPIRVGETTVLEEVTHRLNGLGIRRVRVRVLDETGRPLMGARVSSRDEKGEGGDSSGDRLTDARGETFLAVGAHAGASIVVEPPWARRRMGLGEGPTLQAVTITNPEFPLEVRLSAK